MAIDERERRGLRDGREKRRNAVRRLSPLSAAPAAHARCRRPVRMARHPGGRLAVSKTLLPRPPPCARRPRPAWGMQRRRPVTTNALVRGEGEWRRGDPARAAQTARARATALRAARPPRSLPVPARTPLVGARKTTPTLSHAARPSSPSLLHPLHRSSPFPRHRRRHRPVRRWRPVRGDGGGWRPGRRARGALGAGAGPGGRRGSAGDPAPGRAPGRLGWAEECSRWGQISAGRGGREEGEERPRPRTQRPPPSSSLL